MKWGKEETEGEGKKKNEKMEDKKRRRGGKKRRSHKKEKEEGRRRERKCGKKTKVDVQVNLKHDAPDKIID